MLPPTFESLYAGGIQAFLSQHLDTEKMEAGEAGYTLSAEYPGAAIVTLEWTVRDIDEACEFYARVLGLEVVTFAGGRRALQVGACSLCWGY